MSNADQPQIEQVNQDINQRFDLAIFMCGVGLLEKIEHHERNPEEYFYSSSLKRGLNILAGLCTEYAQSNLKESLACLCETHFITRVATRKISDWPIQWSQDFLEATKESESFDLGPLAYKEGKFIFLSEDCFDFISCREHDVIGGYQQRKVYDLLRVQTQADYVSGRLFLIRHPLLPLKLRQAVVSGLVNLADDPLLDKAEEPLSLSWVEELLNNAYETVKSPNTKICPKCGWTVAKHGFQTKCSSHRCNWEPVYDFDSLEDVEPAALRLKLGVMNYVCSPGRLEVKIAEMAQGLNLDFELWPCKDAADLLVSVGGRTLAIDAKAYFSPGWLQKNIADDSHISTLMADEVIYVVPDDFTRQHPGFCASCNKTLSVKQGYSCMKFTDLKRLFKKHKGELHE